MKRTIQRIPVVLIAAVLMFAMLGIVPAMASLTSESTRLALSNGGTETATATSTETATATSTETATASATPSSTKTPDASPTASKTPEATKTAQPTASATATRAMEIHVRGTVKEVITGSVTIDTTTFKTDGNTRFEPNAAAVVVGAFAEGEGVKQSDGSILATEISVEHAPGAEVEKIEFRGPIQSFSDTQWVVAGKTLSITAQTVISGTPAVGAIAEVKASKLADGTLVALRIKVESASREVERVEFKGVISAFGATEWTVGGKIVAIDANTVISGTPQVGLIAEVRAIKSGTTLTATRITVQRPEVKQIEFKGVISSINGNTWVVGGTTVTVNAQTMIDETRGAAKVGATVEVKGIAQPDGSVLASRIQVERTK